MFSQVPCVPEKFLTSLSCTSLNTERWTGLPCGPAGGKQSLCLEQGQDRGERGGAQGSGVTSRLALGLLDTSTFSLCLRGTAVPVPSSTACSQMAPPVPGPATLIFCKHRFDPCSSSTQFPIAAGIKVKFLTWRLWLSLPHLALTLGLPAPPPTAVPFLLTPLPALSSLPLPMVICTC